MQVMEDCQQIAPKAILPSEIGFEPYNPEVLIFNNRPMFPPDQINSNSGGATLDQRVFCRKSQPAATGITMFADVYIDVSNISTEPPVSSAIIGQRNSSGDILVQLTYEQAYIFASSVKSVGKWWFG
jgi:hypothetical protein